METKDTVASCSVSKEQEIQRLQEKARLSKGGCMKGLKSPRLTFLLDVLQDFDRVASFKRTFFQDIDLLEKHLAKEILYEIDCKTALTKLITMFENPFNSELRERIQKYIVFNAQSFKDTMISDMDFIKKYTLETTLHQQEIQKLLTEKKLLQMTDKYFAEYTGIKVKNFRDTLLQHMSNVKKFVAERTNHKRLYDRRVNKRQMQMQKSKVDTRKALDAGLVIIESSETKSEVQGTSSRSGNDTNTDDVDIRPIYDKEPMAQVQLTAECNVFTIGQQHDVQPKLINEGRVDQDDAQYQVTSPLLNPSLDNMTTEFSNQSLESKNICLKKTVA
ncbi:hypothetical protein Tco_1383137 [Tanacetum coccineum]